MFRTTPQRLNSGLPQKFPASSFAGNLQLCGGPCLCVPFFPHRSHRHFRPQDLQVGKAPRSSPQKAIIGIAVAAGVVALLP
ncbi:hypothetical protein HPP92_023325 [Vanilla planifolia]|uniref:Uncharacterized protein n=1 Tax=Vanilla planifolia TaxID=51239 RepID=A0A835UED0_VANPL|nr:hypothetical protein HPP92_023325 [Vanilla planifolia]